MSELFGSVLIVLERELIAFKLRINTHNRKKTTFSAFFYLTLQNKVQSLF